MLCPRPISSLPSSRDAQINKRSRLLVLTKRQVSKRLGRYVFGIEVCTTAPAWPDFPNKEVGGIG